MGFVAGRVTSADPGSSFSGDELTFSTSGWVE